MNFEVRHALSTLDARTPAFLVLEAFADRNPRSRLAAIQALKEIGARGPRNGPVRQLISMLDLYS